MDDRKERKCFDVDGYKTLPLTFVGGTAVGPIPAFGTGHMRIEYRDPVYNPHPYIYSRECLDNVARSPEFAAEVVGDWTRHFADIGYYLQFRDDPHGDLLKRLHSHTELVSAIVGSRLGLDCNPLWESFDWLLQFKFVQEGYRSDPNREANYAKHVEKLAEAEKKNPGHHRAGRVIERAVNQIEVGATDWISLRDSRLLRSTSAASNPVKIFYSYSHRDEDLVNELQTHLMALQRQGLIDQWHDRRIGPGEEWRGEIDQHLEEADIILLIVSPDFIASSYCYDVEMQRALLRHRDGAANVIPVFLRPCDWEGCPFGKIQGVPKDALPITSWPDRDEALTDVAKGIRKAVGQLRK